MEDMTLREVCVTLEVSRRAVQGYEKAKLVSATGKNKRGYLLYNALAQKRIEKIKLFQDMGFSIKEIAEIIDAPKQVLKEALINRRDCLIEDIKHENSMIVIIQEMIREL